MPAVFAPIDRDLLTGFRQSDERAFERLVRDEFPALNEQATRELGDPAAAGRVAENALLAAWEARDTLDTPLALEHFLKDAVHTGAARERSRRAMLERMQDHEGHAKPHAAAHMAESADDAWAHVAAALHPTLRTAEQSNELRGDLSRHGAASHVASITQREPRFTAKTAALFAIMIMVVAATIGAALAWGTSGSDRARVDAALAADDARVVTTNGGQRARMTLGDGSAVEVGGSSTLRIAPNFAERVRAVGLQGTASLTVAPDSRDRFFVRAGDALLRVTGTVFDVSAFRGDSLVLVHVREGEVSLDVDPAIAIAAGRTVAIAPDGRVSDAPEALAEEAFGWVSGSFAAVDRPLSEVIPLLQRWYGLQLKVTDPALLERRATVRAPLTSSRQAIEQIEATAGVAYGHRNGEPVLFNKAKR